MKERTVAPRNQHIVYLLGAVGNFSYLFDEQQSGQFSTRANFGHAYRTGREARYLSVSTE